MLRSSRMVCFLPALIAAAAATSSDAKVLRNKDNAPAVRVFKDAGALSRFGRVAKASVYDDAVVAPLLACKVPQGSKVDVLGSGYRTAFVRVVEGTANGCQGTVPKGNVSDQ